jgi:hypothetical protein
VLEGGEGMNTEEIFQQVMDENCKDPLHRFAELVRQDEREASDTLKKLAGEALTALEKYNRYEIKTDSYDHSTNLIYDLRDVLNHKRMPLREQWDTTDMAHRPDGLTVDDNIQEYKRPWVGLSEEEVEIYSNMFNGVRFVRHIEALLKERNT